MLIVSTYTSTSTVAYASCIYVHDHSDYSMMSSMHIYGYVNQALVNDIHSLHCTDVNDEYH